MTDVAGRIRAKRQEAGLSQTALAGDELSPSYVSLIEAGKRTPTDEALSIIAARLSTTTHYLRTGSETSEVTAALLELNFAQLALDNGDALTATQQLEALNERAVLVSPMRQEMTLTLASAYERLGRLEDAVAVLEPLARTARDEANWLMVARATMVLVGCYLESGDLNRAVTIGEEALETLAVEGLEGTDEHVRLGATLVWAYCDRGDYLYAQHTLDKLLEAADRVASPRGRGALYWNASLVAHGRGLTDRALELADKAMSLIAEENSIRDHARLYLHQAWLLLRRDVPAAEEALLALDAADRLLLDVNSTIDAASSATERGRALLMLGDVNGAAELAERARSLLGEQPRIEAANSWVLSGDILLASGNAEAAKDYFRRAADLLAMMNANRAAASIWKDLGDRFLADGDTASALRAFSTALSESGVRGSNPSVPVRAPHRRL
jgi:tetratricopeptide (TPR) repeat protein